MGEVSPFTALNHGWQLSHAEVLILNTLIIHSSPLTHLEAVVHVLYATFSKA